MFYKSTKKFLKLSGCISFIFLIISLCFTYTMYQSYKDILYENYLSIASSVIEEHPEFAEEVMDALLHPKVTDEGETILKKYGLNDTDVYEDMKSLKDLRNDIFLKTFIVNVIFVLVLFVIYLYFKRKEFKKIGELQNYFNHILKGDYSVDIREYSESEFSSLKNDIYKVTNLLKEKENYSSNEKRYLESVLSDISHQLKTPLTSMYVINDILENDDIDSDKKKEMLLKNRKQLERIEWLVASLLKLSRLDSGMVTLKKQNILVSELIEQAIAPFRIPIELKEQKIMVNGNKDISLLIDEKWTIEALVNIIKNAYEHTPVSGTITISYSDNPIYTEILIQDTGEGIDSKELPHIFERFYHGTTNKESIGIGLNMAKSIIEKQNGYIKVESKKGKGTTFILQFYKNVL